MKILHIIPSLSKGGAERLVIDICNELQNCAEHSVQIICFRPENDYAFATKELEIKVIPSSVSSSLTGKNQVNVTELQQEIDRFKPTVIHSHLFETEMVLSEIDYPSAKYFVHFHNNMPQFSFSGIQTKSIKQKITDAYEKAKVTKKYRKRKTRAITISKDTFEYAKNVLPKKVDVTLQLNAISYERFFTPIVRKQEVRIVTIGSLVPNKGHHLALEVIERLQSNNISVHFDILGDGQLMNELKSLSKHKGIDNHVHFHGNVDYPEQFLHQATIYLHTAKKEAFGLVLLEAMAAGLPIVCTDGFGNRDLINEGENGFLFKERSAEVISKKISELIIDRDLAEKIGSNGQVFSKGFDITAYVEKLLKLYEGN